MILLAGYTTRYNDDPDLFLPGREVNITVRSILLVQTKTDIIGAHAHVEANSFLLE